MSAAIPNRYVRHELDFEGIANLFDSVYDVDNRVTLRIFARQVISAALSRTRSALHYLMTLWTVDRRYHGFVRGFGSCWEIGMAGAWC